MNTICMYRVYVVKHYILHLYSYCDTGVTRIVIPRLQNRDHVMISDVFNFYVAIYNGYGDILCYAYVLYYMYTCISNP